MLLSRSDRQNFAKSLRKSEKKVRELSLQVEEERRHADQYKKQYDKTSQKLRQSKRQMDNKLTAPFAPEPYKVTQKNGSREEIESSDGV